MPDRPLLIFPEPTTPDRHLKTGGMGESPRSPGFARQVERIDDQLGEVETVIEARHMELTAEVPGAEAEMMLVLETVGRIDNFVKAVENEKIEGLEWLGDFDEYEIRPDDDFYYEAEKDRPLGGRLYLVMSNRVGVQQLLAMWKEYKDNEGHPHYARGLAKWRQVFDLLKVVRPWGIEDRLTLAVLADWRERVRQGHETVRVEIELWPRRDAARRQQAVGAVSRLVEALGGTVATGAYIEEIHYHGVLAILPIAAVEQMLDNGAVKLVKCEDIMFFEPTGQMAVPLPTDLPLPATAVPATGAATGPPVVALLDGLPLANHRLLTGRLVLDDPDGWSAGYPVAQRVHGTAMASLIIHGDLQGREQPLARPLYARPIMQANALGECVPEDVLLVDLVHTAVRRLFVGADGERGVAPSVRVINFSVGDPSRLFDRTISPLGRLLDWLSAEYGVVFVVSAGNHATDLELNVPKTDGDALRADPARLRQEVLQCTYGERLHHPLYSPAEGVNVLTVGAAHCDGSAGTKANPALFDPLDSADLPSPVNAQGPGFRRSLKPEILAPGGRVAYRSTLVNNGANLILEPVRNQTRLCGHRVAAPSVTPGDMSDERLTCGTSNAAALVSRAAGMLYDVVDSLRVTPGGDRLTREYEVALLKALLVHSAAWGEAADLLWPVSDLREKKALLAQLVGYGRIHADRVLSCEDERVTLLGFGHISPGQGQQFALPLPPSLNLVAGRRTLVSTLAWITPINPRHNRYRRADLWFNLYGQNPADNSCKELLGVTRCGVETYQAQRGTVQHEVLTGDRAVPFGTHDAINIQVNCRADAGECSDEVPYGLVVTLEVEPEMGISVYDEIELRLRQPVPIAPIP